MNIQVPSDFDAESLSLLMGVASSLGITVVQQPTLVVIGSKIIQGVVNCNLCSTVTIQYMQLNKYSDGRWIKAKDLEPEDIIAFDPKKFEIYTARVKSCWACESVLMQKEKKELVDMLLKVLVPVTTRKEIIRQIKELRKG